MRIALLASSYLPQRGGLERHVHELAHGLAVRGAEVELLVPGLGRGTERVSRSAGVTVRRFSGLTGPLRVRVAPALWDRLRAIASEVDLIDVHTVDARLALAAISSGAPRCVFTTHAPLGVLMSWPQARATTAVLAAADRVVCRSSFESELLCGRFPAISDRTTVVPVGVDTAAIRSADAFPHAANVVLAVGALERSKRIDRVIAALAGLAPGYRLVVLGDGRLRHRLDAHAADLRVSSHVEFRGAVDDLELYRWLRSAAVVVALHEGHGSGIHITEALAAGAPVVASDVPVHREVAGRYGGGRVRFVSAHGSPFEVADAIAELAGRRTRDGDVGLVSTETVADQVWELYRGLREGAGPRARGGTRVWLPVRSTAIGQRSGRA